MSLYSEEQPTPADGRIGGRPPIFWLLIVPAIAGLIVYGVTLMRHHHAGPADQSNAIETLIGSNYCDQSGYQVISKLDGSKSTIYDCELKGKLICVTYANNIADNATEEVKLLFSNTLGSAKPACIR